ncbi:MAG TPA: efflux transporter outer membrane subunit [Bryobacteraceae bacterium]|nr:efflux transporter outer membrane subunit [Bryobacteraceae bacterium]
MNRLTTSVSFAALLAAGCGGTRYQRPDVPTPPNYRGEVYNAEPKSLGELKWQDVIRDDELARLIEEALAHNFDAQIAAARVLEARAQLTISRSARLPALDAQSGYSNLRALAIDSSDTNLSVSLGWELDLWGRIRNANVAARAALLASEEARRTVLQTLLSDVVNAYFLLRDLDLEREITNRDLKLRQDSLDLVQLRVDNGYSSEIELRQADVLVKSARTALTSLELQTEQTENELSILLGRNPGPIVVSRGSVDEALFTGVPPGLPSTLLDRRPDIRQAEQQLIGDHALVAVARAAFFPTISLTASTGFASSALLNLFSPTNGTWLFGPVGNLPIFHAGAIRAEVRIAEARRQEDLLAYQQTVQRAFREVADSLAGSRKLAELRTEQTELVESLRQGAELADLAYRGGLVSYLEYLDSERQLLDAELQLVQIRRQELTNVVTLYRSLGGGWQ